MITTLTTPLPHLLPHLKCLFLKVYHAYHAYLCPRTCERIKTDAFMYVRSSRVCKGFSVVSVVFLKYQRLKVW